MGCFLGCFGFSTKRTPRKSADKVLLGDQTRYLSYKPLDSSASINHDITDYPVDSDIRNEAKQQESNIDKVKKKVRFDLNVQAYEPIPNEEDATHWEDACKTITNESQSTLIDYPTNHRYQNVGNSYDEDEDNVYGSDPDDEFDDDGYEDDFDLDDEQLEDQRVTMNREDLSEQFKSFSMESNTDNHLLPLSSSTDYEKESTGLNRYARERNSLLMPIENLAQWKAVKAKAAADNKHARKENIPPDPFLPLESRPLLQETAINTSLSNRLASLKYKEPKPESRSVTVNATTLSDKKNPFEKSYSWRSREDEDMPILDLTGFEI
ncbi:hypothetical protein ACFE04_015986 [Oxalis oulophora]